MALQPSLLQHPPVPSARSPSPSSSTGTEAAPKSLLLGAPLALCCMRVCSSAGLRVLCRELTLFSAHCSHPSRALSPKPHFVAPSPIAVQCPAVQCPIGDTQLGAGQVLAAARGLEAESVVCSPLKAPFSPCCPLFLLGEFHVPCVTRSLFFVILAERAGQEVALQQRQPQRQHGVGSFMEGLWGIRAQPV